MKLPILLVALTAASSTQAQVPPHSAAAASGVIERYYAAIDRGDYRTAYYLWDNGGRLSGRSLASFAAGFARTARTSVIVGKPHDEEGAAGSSYITVPVTVRARLKDGRRQTFVGSYVLRFSSVTEAGEPPKPWYLYSAKLKSTR